MYFKIPLLLACLMLAPVANAATLDFTFSFNDTANVSGLVTGVVRGLTDDASSAASSVEVLTSEGSFGLGEYGSSPIFNTFTVNSGAITAYDFVSTIGTAALNSTLSMNAFSFALSDEIIFLVTNGSVTFTPITSAVVPLPAGGVLLLTGFAALAALRRRKAVAE